MTGSEEQRNIRVEHLAGDSFVVGVRGHRVVVDQPVANGGDDLGPTPTELFVSGLAACVAFYAERYLRRHSLPVAGLAVDASFDLSTDRPARVSDIRLHVTVPPELPETRRGAFLRVVEHCTVHNSIVQAPDIQIELDVVRRAA
jgi:uncharacterized OsmC-like protein